MLITLLITIMGTAPPRRARKIDIINVWVTSHYKEYLDDFKKKERYETQGEALMGMMDDHELQAKRIKKLEQQIRELGHEPIADDSVSNVEE